MNISNTMKYKFKGTGRRNSFGSFFYPDVRTVTHVQRTYHKIYSASPVTYRRVTLSFTFIFCVTFVLLCDATFADQKPLKYSVSKYLSSRISSREISVIKKVAASYKLTQEQFDFLCIIRIVENGRAGREFGVLHRRALNKSFKVQCEWAAGSVKRRYRRSSDLKAFAARWCPIGAENDPSGLNHNWYVNARACLKERRV